MFMFMFIRLDSLVCGTDIYYFNLEDPCVTKTTWMNIYIKRTTLNRHVCVHKRI